MAEIRDDPRYDAYRDAIRRRVCTVCLDQRDDGHCGVSGRVCALEAHLPDVIQALLSVRSHRMDEYVAAIRAEVCSGCEQKSDGHCDPRERGNCALDTYLALVLDAVQEVEEASGRTGPTQ